MILGMTNEREWFTAAAGRRITATEIGEMLGVSRRTATNRLGDGLDSDDIIAISRKLGVSPISALVELGKVSYEEVFNFLDNDGTLLATASPEQLIRALAEESLSITDRIEIGASAQAMANKRDELAARRNRNSNTTSPRVHPLSDDEIADAIREANQLQGAAQQRTEELTEPENP